MYYLSSDHLPPEEQAPAAKVAAFAVSSFSRAVVLERHLPVPVTPTLYRIDLRELEWRWQDWHAVLKDYTYAPGKFPPLIVRMDWLTVELVDNFAGDDGYRLLYGGKNIPATRDDFLKFWDVSLESSTDPLLLARVDRDDDGNSPSLLSVRRIENRPTENRGYAYGTEDVARENLTADNDSLERLIGNRDHDAEEWIVGFPKISIAQGAGGMAQAYLLSNGKGVRQDRAPTEIVRDANQPRGDVAIRNTIGCVICHPRGINELATNDLRDLIGAGVDLYADKKTQELIEAQYLADQRLKVEITRDREDYTAYLALATGLPPEEFVAAFEGVIESYDAPLALEDAAREVYVEADELRLALGYASARNVDLGARLAGLAHGRSVERPYWESAYSIVYGAVELWREAKR